MPKYHVEILESERRVHVVWANDEEEAQALIEECAGEYETLDDTQAYWAVESVRLAPDQGE
jgi:hypothetical protein